MRVRRRKHMCLHRGAVPQAQRTHERWSMDFLWSARHEQLVRLFDAFRCKRSAFIYSASGERTRSGHQGQSHTSGPISAEAFGCRKSRRVLGRDEDRFHLKSTDLAEIGQLSSNHAAAAACLNTTSSPRSMAQQMRTILLARAQTATWGCIRTARPRIHRWRGSSRLSFHTQSARAP